MPKTLILETSNKNPTVHLAFKPRQVVLQQLRHNPASMEQKRLSNKDKTLLLRSIARFLESSGFSKTLKKFRSEAQVQKQDSEDSLFDLEEIFSKFLEKRDDASKKFESNKVEEVNSQENKKIKKNSDSIVLEEQTNAEVVDATDNVVLASVDKKSKDKKKKNNNGQVPSESLAVAAIEKSKDVGLSDNNKVTDSATEKQSKDKKKKKNKLSSDPANKVEQPISDSKGGAEAEIMLDDKNANSKAKKKKKDTPVSENLSGSKVDEGKSDKVGSEKDDLKKMSKEDAGEKQNKSSKKRKRLPSEEDDTQSSEDKAVQVSKRRRTDGSEETTGNDQSKKLKSSSETDKKARKEKSMEDVSGNESQKIDSHANGNLKSNGEKSEKQKTMKMQNNGSAEPKTVKHFQRVKVDEVVFTDDRLQDNSYWAKDGAESGYGAKAQEILGQVRGRGFRHEKTKKKRGTYRGGQIDVDSHSIKFNYSDEE